VALVSSVEVLAAAVLARVAQLEALIHIDVAVGSFESFLTRAFVRVLHRGALGSISAGLVSAVVLLCTVVT